MRPDFERAQSLATSLLLQQNLSGLKIDIRKFIFERNILIFSAQYYAKTVGCSVKDILCDEVSGACTLNVNSFDTALILYDESENNICRKLWGITHEVGHTYLEHAVDDGIAEIEANFFTAQILCPEISIWYAAERLEQGIDPGFLYNHYNLSYTAACHRIGTMRRRNCYNSGANDRLLLNKLQPHLDATIERISVRV